VAEPVALDPASVRLDSAYQRRCVVEDFAKSFLAALAGDRLDWLVVDLIDERFDVLRTPRSFVTCSSAYTSAGLEADHDFDRVRRLTGEARGLVEAAARTFARRVTEVLAPDRVIVHRARWLPRYRDERGAVRDFPADRADYAAHHNAALDHAYDVLERELGGKAATISLDGGHLADARHRWGLEPYHYEPAYNADAAQRLRALVDL
jgi:hypothetical protein